MQAEGGHYHQSHALYLHIPADGCCDDDGDDASNEFDDEVNEPGGESTTQCGEQKHYT